MVDEELRTMVVDLFGARDEEERDAARFLLREKICDMSPEQLSWMRETTIKFRDVLDSCILEMED